MTNVRRYLRCVTSCALQTRPNFNSVWHQEVAETHACFVDTGDGSPNLGHAYTTHSNRCNMVAASHYSVQPNHEARDINHVCVDNVQGSVYHACRPRTNINQFLHFHLQNVFERVTDEKKVIVSSCMRFQCTFREYLQKLLNLFWMKNSPLPMKLNNHVEL